MNPLLYALIGLLAGAGIATIIFAITRRKPEDDSELIKRFELLERAQERGERLIREEMARGREENANAAKTQRGELTASLESEPLAALLRALKQFEALDQLRFVLSAPPHEGEDERENPRARNQSDQRI